jgi:outer membrane protein assembly factor BamC
MRSIGIVAAIVVAMLVAGCSGSISERRKIDYKSAGRLPPLEVPPDLVTPRNSERFNVPPEEGSTFSDYTRERDAARSGEQDTSILPAEPGMQVVRDGTFRWLTINAEPDELWQPLREFWQETGFLIAYEIPEAGIMETDWAENRAKVPLGAVRSWVKSVFDSAYSYPERDKFRTRVERGDKPGYSEIYISHRAMYEVLTKQGRSQESTIWQVRPTDPELEAEMLYRLMARLGGTQQEIQQARVAPPPPPRATLNRVENLDYLEIRDPFDEAWRRVGLALDRVGFTVEDRDREQGVYFVRYNDPDAENSKGGIGRLAFWRDDDFVDTQYHILVTGVDDVDDGSEVSEIRVQDAEGETIASSTASRILALLQDELK